jgi:uncharacterized damage-inducible protein DinB
MDTGQALEEAYRRINELVHQATDGLGHGGLVYRPEPGANSIAWLVWHLTRIQDDHLAALAGVSQLWEDRSWVTVTGIDPPVEAAGQGDGPDDVAAIQPGSSEGLLKYHDAVMRRSVAYVRDLTPGLLDEIIDRSYDPPVTRGVRLVSVLSDNIQHAGQARYLRGIVDRLGI